MSEAINYTLQIADALVHAAERGVVHRDIKPSNIIVTPQGRAKLVDMGLARRFERGNDDGLTQSGMTLGTFDYISPEQARDPRDVDVRSDLYSLGCTLFHMLTGRPPFPEGTVLQKLLQHQEEPPPDVCTLNPARPARPGEHPRQADGQGPRSALPDARATGPRPAHRRRDARAAIGQPRGPGLVVGDRPGRLGAAPGLGHARPGLRAGHDRAWSGGVRKRARPPPALPDVLPRLTVQASGPRAVQRPARRSGSRSPGTRPGATTRHGRGGGAAPRRPRPRDISVDSSEDLLAVLASAPPRTIVVLADDGPYVLGGESSDRHLPPQLLDRDLTIKADAGVLPTLRLARNAVVGGKAPRRCFDLVGGHVTLEGLEFVLDPVDRDGPLAAIRTEDTELIVRRCLFRRQGQGRPGTPRDRVAALHVRATAALNGDRPAAVTADACHFDGGQVGVLAHGPVDLQLRDCTLGEAEPAVWFENGEGRNGRRPPSSGFATTACSPATGRSSASRGSAPRVWIDDSVIAPARDAEATLVAADDPDGLVWRGRGNLYGRIGIFLQPSGARHSGETDPRVRRLGRDRIPDPRDGLDLHTGAGLERGRPRTAPGARKPQPQPGVPAGRHPNGRCRRGGPVPARTLRHPDTSRRSRSRRAWPTAVAMREPRLPSAPANEASPLKVPDELKPMPVADPRPARTHAGSRPRLGRTADSVDPDARDARDAAVRA